MSITAQRTYKGTLLDDQRVAGSFKDLYLKVTETANTKKFKRAAIKTVAVALGLAALLSTDIPRKAMDYYKNLGPSIDNIGDYLPPENLLTQ